jgi:hypothetical protein
MNTENSKSTRVKQEIARQLAELAKISLYLAFFFCALTTYKMLLLNEFHAAYFDYGTALINALVVGKVILLGQDLHLGKKHEQKALLISAIYKAFLFGLLVFAFHLVEEAIKRLLHGNSIAVAFHDVRIDDLLARTVIMFLTFIPLFAFLELRRVLGDEKFHGLLFKTREAAKSDP